MAFIHLLVQQENTMKTTLLQYRLFHSGLMYGLRRGQAKVLRELKWNPDVGRGFSKSCK